MKKLYLFLLIVLLACSGYARILILNNNGTNTGHYRTIYEALAAAQNGDTIYCVGSSIRYDSTQGVEITKAVTIIGPGYFLAENPGTNTNFSPAIFNTITISSPNISLIGLFIYRVTVLTGNLSIKRCNIDYMSHGQITSQINNIVISQCYLGSVDFYSGQYQINDVIFTNNYVLTISEGTPGSSSWGLNTISYNNWVINGNTFMASGSFFFGETLINNIFATSMPNTFCPNCSIEYCIFINDPVPATNNNLINVDFNTLFVGSIVNSTDGQWKLKPGSPAIGSGFNGVDRGMFGGNTPYVLSGVPPIPAVYGLTVQPVSTNNALPVQVKIKSNN